MVYFHNPKYARQPQLPLTELAQSAIHSLPLMTELFPDIKVYYDDDPFIPLLMDSPTHDEEGRTKGPNTIQDFVRPPPPAQRTRSSFAWLICCSSVFLLDLATGTLWVSPDSTLLPLMALFSDPAAAPQQQNAPPPRAHLSTAHGHITLLSEDS